MKRSEAHDKEGKAEEDHRHDPSTYNVNIKQLAIREFQGKSYEKESYKSIAQEWTAQQNAKKEEKKKKKQQQAKENGENGGKKEKAKRAERERKSRFMVIDNYTVLRAQVEEDDEEKLGYASTHIQKKVPNLLSRHGLPNTVLNRNEASLFRRITVMFARTAGH